MFATIFWGVKYHQLKVWNKNKAIIALVFSNTG